MAAPQLEYQYVAVLRDGLAVTSSRAQRAGPAVPGRQRLAAKHDADCARLAVDLERLLPKVDAEDLDEDRRIAFAEAGLSKIAALEAAADGDAAVLAQVATYEEAMLGVIDGLRPPRRRKVAAGAAASASGAAPSHRAKRVRERSRGGAPQTRPIPCKKSWRR